TEDDYGSDHVIGYDTYTLVIQAVLNGQVDCAVLDDSVAKAYVAENPGLMILDTEYAVESYAFGVDKTNTALLDAVNAALSALIADGTVDEIISRYISD
ncbi:MAG: transporter substrate-binding domain-containing protein, partial [Oscillospiraceae bacterium]|nr:transporter substrate-binding domain-containing protein [Oscillospiraceae bacterium]